MKELRAQEDEVNALCEEFRVSERVDELTYDKTGREIEHNDGTMVLTLCRLSDIVELLDSPDPVLRTYAQDIASAWAEAEAAYAEAMTDQLKAYARAMEAQVKAYAEAMEAQAKAHAEEMALGLHCLCIFA
jgi:uncharacterized protein Yka (UPF0111/DUF47 family)